MIVGDYYDPAGQLHGFVYQNGQYTTVDYPGSPDTILSGIDDAGLIVGGYGADKIAAPDGRASTETTMKPIAMHEVFTQRRCIATP